MHAGRRFTWRKPATTTLPSETTSSPAETEEAGRRVGERLRRGGGRLLTGALRAGKTDLLPGGGAGAGPGAPGARPALQLARGCPRRLQPAAVRLYRVPSD